ncbi:tyrosine-type recombinase/integrase [Actinomyces oris]|uniref:tyrosine-type recombinase/integrase n=1 Tax=Actinomyces oris TaxID=544580 RepID=UPI0028525BA2|nr:tyrosine-type recombinase/integrase [Actinomyces oris]
MTTPLRIVGDGDAPTLLVEAWEASMQGQGLSQRTITERVRVINQVTAATGADPAVLTPQAISAWLATLPSAATKSTYYAVLRAWCKWLVQSDHRADDPTTRVARPKTPAGHPRPVTDAQLDAVLALPLHQDTRTKIILAAYAGMRVHEIAKIKGEDISPVAGTITITGKGGRTDTLPAHQLILQQANLYPRRGFWFPSPKDPAVPVRAKTVSAAISAAFDRADAPATAHQLRHYHATSLLRAGADSRVVQSLMRHESLATTGRYLAVNTDQQRAALSGLHPTPNATQRRVDAGPDQQQPPVGASC